MFNWFQKARGVPPVEAQSVDAVPYYKTTTSFEVGSVRCTDIKAERVPPEPDTRIYSLVFSGELSPPYFVFRNDGTARLLQRAEFSLSVGKQTTTGAVNDAVVKHGPTLLGRPDWVPVSVSINDFEQGSRTGRVWVSAYFEQKAPADVSLSGSAVCSYTTEQGAE